MIADLADVVERHDRILYELQQQMGSSVNVPTSDPNPTYETITLSDGTTTVVLDFSAAVPTGVALATGSIFNNNYVDVSWDVATDDRVHEYSVDYARKVAGVYQLEDSSGKIGGSSLRVEGLMPNTTYGFRVWGYNGLGLPSATPAWVDIVTGQDNTVPAALTGLTLTAGFRSVLFKWNPSADTDVVRGGLYKMEIATNVGFTTGVQTKLTTAYVDSFDNLATGTQYWGRIYPIDASGNQGPPLSAGPVTTAQVVNGDLANLLVDAAKLANSAVTSTKIANLAVGTAAIALLAVDTAQMADLAVTNAKIDALAVDDGKINNLSAAKVTFGTMSGDRISANTLDVIALKSSTLTTATLTLNGGTLRALNGTGGVGMAINSQGISIYNSAGTRTIFLDASTGAGTFAGTLSGATGTFAGSLTAASGTITGWLTTGAGGGFRTAASGLRVEVSSSATGNIRFYSGGTGETTPAQLVAGQTFKIAASKSSIGGPEISLYTGSVAGASSIHQITLGSTGNQVQDIFFDASVVWSGSSAGTKLNVDDINNPWGGPLDVKVLDAIKMQVTNNGVVLRSTMYLKADGDANHLLAYSSGGDGTDFKSFQYINIMAPNWDVRELVGTQSSVLTQNLSGSGWREHKASTHTNLSDIRFKKVRASAKHSSGNCRDIVSEVGRPFLFCWKKGTGDDGQNPRWGFDANKLPAEFVAETFMEDGSKSMGVDPQSMISVLYGALNDVIEDINDLTTQYRALTARVDKLAA